jgi:hypothetical protein
MSKVKKLVSSATKLLGLQAPKLPAAEVPAAAAPMTRGDTGAIVNIGTPRNDSRVSGGGNTSIGRQQDIFSGLTLGGLRI